MTRRFGFFSLAMLLAVAPLLAMAEVYRWVDDRGQVHYSQVPPTGRDARPIGPPPPPQAAPNQDNLNQSLKDANEAAPKTQAEADRLAQSQANVDEYCKQLRSQLAYLDEKTARRLGATDDKGNVTRVTEEEFQQRRNEILKNLGERCS
jgi:hypothetical protein